MDISKASNFERFVFDLMGADGKATAAMFKQVDQAGGFDISKEHIFKEIGKYGFQSGRSTHANRLETIRDIDKRYGVMIDTHTADGVKVAREHLQAGVPMLVLETALPIKFEETIQEALGRPAECPPAFKDIQSQPQRVENIDADVNQVKTFITSHLA
jgi:threonine synthase